jgi:hypothetical protein
MSEFYFHLQGRISVFIVLLEDGGKAILRNYEDIISTPDNEEIPRNILTSLYQTNGVNLYNCSWCALAICRCTFLPPKMCTITWGDEGILFQCV